MFISNIYFIVNKHHLTISMGYKSQLYCRMHICSAYSVNEMVLWDPRYDKVINNKTTFLVCLVILEYPR